MPPAAAVAQEEPSTCSTSMSSTVLIPVRASAPLARSGLIWGSPVTSGSRKSYQVFTTRRGARSTDEQGVRRSASLPRLRECTRIEATQ